MFHVTGLFKSRKRLVGPRGDTLSIDERRCEISQGGGRLFHYERSQGGLSYRKGLFTDLIVFEGDSSKARFKFHPSDRWGPFGSRLPLSLSTRLASAPLASRSEVVGVLRELGWLAD